LKDERNDIESKDRPSKKDRERLKIIEEEMKPLENFINDARKHREQIKLEIGMLF
jgi:hypothetical protein